MKSFLVILTKQESGKFCAVGAVGQHTSFEDRPQPPLSELAKNNQSIISTPTKESK